MASKFYQRMKLIHEYTTSYPSKKYLAEKYAISESFVDAILRQAGVLERQRFKRDLGVKRPLAYFRELAGELYG